MITAQYSVNSYRLTIYYRYENGTTAATTYTRTYNYGASYSVTSPTVSGYTPDTAVVSGVMGAGNVTVTVTYHQDVTILLGDVDCNGVVDFSDVSLLSMYLAGISDVTPQGLLNADMNQDGSVAFSDVTAIYMFLIG